MSGEGRGLCLLCEPRRGRFSRWIFWGFLGFFLSALYTLLHESSGVPRQNLRLVMRRPSLISITPLSLNNSQPHFSHILRSGFRSQNELLQAALVGALTQVLFHFKGDAHAHTIFFSKLQRAAVGGEGEELRFANKARLFDHVALDKSNAAPRLLCLPATSRSHWIAKA